MPETFGSGTAGLGYDPRILPFPSVSHSLSAGAIWTWTPTENNLWIVTAVDLFAYTGGPGGLTVMKRGSSGPIVCGFNIGTGNDAFSWRGWLALVYSSGGILTIDNSIGETPVDVTISG